MAIVIGVKFRSGKMYYFSPKDIEFKEGEAVITETARGVECGIVAMANREVDDKEIVPLRRLSEKLPKRTPKSMRKTLPKGMRLYKLRWKKLKSIIWK